MMRVLKWLALALLVLVAAGAAWGIHLYRSVPDIGEAAPLFDAPPPTVETRVRVSWLGVATLLIEDGETAIMTDGFFSRPRARSAFLGQVEPDRALIAQSLDRAGVRKLAAVIPVHSHYDHAMDAPEVARLTGALLVGSESTANIGRGWGLPEDRIKVVGDGDALTFGRFKVRFLAGRHVPSPFTGGSIDTPLVPPVRSTAYFEGTSYILHVEHEGRRLLIVGSAGFVPGKLAGIDAETVFLGAGLLGRQSEDYGHAYWDEIVAKVGARRVIPIHWDNFTLPLTEPLAPMPCLFDDFGAALASLRKSAAASGVRLQLINAWTATDPFAGPTPGRP
jgi:L-ascorbate metabolism protein UlaG (beta-lactamase superfamily)